MGMIGKERDKRRKREGGGREGKNRRRGKENRIKLLFGPTGNSINYSLFREVFVS